MNSFIPWVGGKSKLLWIINKMAPDHYSRFIDVFGGSGTVTMSRPIQPGCMEVYNDFNSNLTNLFCCVKNRPLALLAELGFLPLNTRDDFNVLYKFLSKGEITDDYLQEEMELTEILLKPPEAEAIRTLLLERAPRGDVRRAADFFKLVRYSFSGSSKSVSYTHLDVYKRQGRLAVLDETEQEAFDGLLRLEIQRKVESNGGILTMQDLRNLAVSADADCCHVVGATSDAELGRFYAENGFVEELDGLSDDVFEMLDFGKIGKALRTGENGTFTRNGYVVQHSELVTAPLCAKELPPKPEYLFQLTLGLHPDLDDDRTVTLELPASAEALRNAQQQLGTDGWEGVVVLDYDGIIPQAAEFADLPMELEAFNDFAESVKAMPFREKQLPKLKALLEHFEVTDLAAAAGLAEHIGDYILTPEISSPQEAAIDELNFTMDAHSVELLLPHVNLFAYGNEIIKDDNAALTSYGLLHREDYQPMQTPVQETQEQAMTME